MKHKKLLFIFIICVLPVWGYAQIAQQIFREFRPKICLVTFYKNVSSQSQIGTYLKIKQHRIGLIVREDGLVMVNSDVYPLSLDILSGENSSLTSNEPSSFKVKLFDDREFDCEFVGKEEVAQVAFIQITDTLGEPLPFITFGPSDLVEVGESVYIFELLGKNYNFEPLFTPYMINSIVALPRRKFLIKNEVTALSAGGLVITQDGSPIGVTLRVDFDFDFQDPSDFDDYRRDYMEIIPSEKLIELINNPPVLKKSVHLGKSWFGIGMQALTPDLMDYWNIKAEGGVIIDRIYPESPAEKAGLKVKDVILTFDDQELDIQRGEDLNRFREMVTGKEPNTTVKITIYRDGKIRSKNIKLTPAPPAIDLSEKFQSSDLGVEVRELTWDILFNYNFPLETKGVYVYQVDRASPAGLGGLSPGGIITSVNGRPVRNLKSFEKIIVEIMENNPNMIMFQMQFRRETVFVFVNVK